MRATKPQWLKLLALPLTQGAGGSNAAPPPFLLHALKGSLASATSQSGQPTHRRLLNKSIDKAADLWAGLGKAKEGSMKVKIYVRRRGRRSLERAAGELWRSDAFHFYFWTDLDMMSPRRTLASA